MPQKKKSKKPAAKKSAKSGRSTKPAKPEKSETLEALPIYSEVTPAQWKRLVALASEYRDLKPWEWIYDADFFGVKSPAHDDICYGSIMGSAGLLYGLAAYIGPTGLNGFLDTADGVIHPLDFLYMQKCLISRLEAKDQLMELDTDIFVLAGVSIKGNKKWPTFRSYEPGLMEWYLTHSWQAELLADVFEAALYIAPIAKVAPERLAPEDENLVLLLTLEKTPDGYAWKESFFTPERPEEPELTPLACNQIRLQKIKNETTVKPGAWEGDLFHLPSPMVDREDQRPYYPRMAIWADAENGMALHFGVDEDSAGLAFFQETFLQSMEKSKQRPELIYLCRFETEAAIKNVTELLGIKVELVEELPVIFQIREEMEDAGMDMDEDDFDELEELEVPGKTE